MVHGIVKITRALEHGALFINENPHIVRHVHKVPLYNDEPKVYYYASYINDRYRGRHNEESVASGVSFTKNTALLRLFGETIERYALSINNNKKFIYESFSNLQKTNKTALDPNSLSSFSYKQLHLFRMTKKNLSELKLHWVIGMSIVSNKPILVPAQLVYVPYVYQDSEPLIRVPISTGAAAGSSLREALYNGICEVIERDSFMIAYLNKLPSPQNDITHTKNLREIVEKLNRYNLRLYIMDLTTDITVPSIAAILIDETKLGPTISIGLKAGFDINKTIVGAIEEAIMLRSWIRDKFIYTDPHYKRASIIRTIEDRAHFWFDVKTIKYLDFWLNSPNIKRVKNNSPQATQKNLDKIIGLLKQKNFDIIYVDLTDKKIKKYGFTVVKVIIPQLQPLYLDEKYSYFGVSRLYSAPLDMRVLKEQKNENELNTIPHPFL